MNIYESNSTYFPLHIVPLPQFSALLEREAVSLGLQNASINGSIVSGTADWTTAYRLLYESRLAIRILSPVLKKKILDKDDLYKAASGIPWERIIYTGSTFSVDVQGKHDSFHRLSYAALVVKDAIVDRCRTRTRARPDVDTADPDIRINLFLTQSALSVLSLDFGQGSLYKRKYRESVHEAPLNEVLASSLLEFCSYSPVQTLFDPFCGSGTILAEGAMRLSGMPAGFFRYSGNSSENSGNSRDLPSSGMLPFGQPEAWRDVVTAANTGFERRSALLQKRPVELYIAGSDISEESVGQTSKTLARIFAAAGLSEDFFQVDVMDACELMAPAAANGKPGMVLSNPPYDERMKTEDIRELYHRASLRLKDQLPGWTIHILTGSSDAVKAFALRTESRLSLYNGPIKCTLLSSSIFPEKRKDFP
ncbi:THUMP domain-containing class I SAM-dependent RNA methyltransferase [Spirochaeta dissipatitropha]